MGKISTKLLKRLEDIKNQKIINLNEFREANKKSEEDLKTVKTPWQLGSEYHPFHAVYASTQNLVSLLAENLSALDELDEFTKIASEAEDTYMPGYPPMSPITNSFFSFWTFFDLRFGIDKETIGTCLIDLSDALQMDKGTVELIKNLQASRMGIYLHQGSDESGNIYLLEVYTHKTYRCYSTSKYQGKKGEIWFVRLAPPPFNLSDLYITITTPYVITHSNQKDWEAYFERVITRMGMNPPILAYEELMKYGLIPNYWNEYVFLAYSNHRDNVIFLFGIPDKPETLPHFSPNTSIDLSKIQMNGEKKKAIKNFKKKLKKG